MSGAITLAPETARTMLREFGRGRDVADIATIVGKSAEVTGLALVQLCGMDRGRARTRALQPLEPHPPAPVISAPAAPLQRAGNSRSGEQLGAQEQTMLNLLAQPLTLAQIAERMHVSESTAKTTQTRLNHKLGVSDRVSAVIAGIRTGLLTIDIPDRPGSAVDGPGAVVVSYATDYCGLCGYCGPADQHDSCGAELRPVLVTITEDGKP